MARLKMISATLFPFLLWVTLAVAQASNIDSTDLKVHANHAARNTPQSPKQPLVTPPKSEVYTPHGCFSGISERGIISRISSNSPSACYQECEQKGANVMILRGLWCYCADKYPDKKFLIPDGYCNLGCQGSPKFACGGNGYRRAFSVYNMGQVSDLDYSNPDAALTKTKAALPPKTSDYTSQDCFGELPKRFTWLHSKVISPEWCYIACKNRENSVMLMRYDRCYCADKYPTEQSRLDAKKCNQPCSDEPAWACGGKEAYSVYNLENKVDVGHELEAPSPPKPTTPDQLTSQGCFKELPQSATRVYPQVEGETKFAEACVARCRFQARSIAMVVENAACYCATTYSSKKALVTNDLCQMPCSSSSAVSCRGRQHFYTAYNTGRFQRVKHEDEIINRPPQQSLAEKPKLNKMTSHGCYRALPETVSRKRRADRSINTDNNCSFYCKFFMGKAVAVTQGYKCICSDTYPRKSSKLSDEHCNTPCPGYPGHVCGGRRAWSVINTGLHVAVDDDKEAWDRSHPEPPKLPFYGCFNDTPAWFKPMYLDRAKDLRPQGDSCTYKCAAEGYPVAIRGRSDCYCSRSYPPDSSRVNESECKFPCFNDAREMCGGQTAYNVYRTRLDWAVDDEDNDPNTSAVTRPWQCPHPALQRVKDVGSWIARQAAAIAHEVMGIVYLVENALRTCFWWVERLLREVLAGCMWLWDKGGRVMDL
ncbi:hypothetical protein ACHAPT_012015 [Fusarium lateritium]